jgi:NhaP-type Na+/H+ or K+/H+ antiporter
VRDPILYHTALAVALGMAAQAVALRFALPSIVVLLAVGVSIGPDMLGLFDPRVFGNARTDLVSLAVTIILFEGGLALRVEEMRSQQRSLTMLLTLGAAISMVVGTAAAHYVLDMPWPIASLYGSLMIVTGPTVVTPLLARLSVERPLRELLISEGVLNDPIGAIISIVALEYVLGQRGMWATGSVALVRLLLGAGVGAVAGLGMTVLLRRRWVREELWNPTVLASVLLAASAASRLSAEAGLMTAVTQGVVMANTGLRELRRLRRFNEEITVVLLSFVFVLLAADLPLSEVQALGWSAVWVVILVIWVARPLAVFTCTVGSELNVRQRLFLSWVCPRGIVAASVAGLFRLLLNQADILGGSRLEALVFVTVALTVAVQGSTIGPVARSLRVDLPSLGGTIIVGAHRFGRLLARLLIAYGRQVVLIDRNREHVRAAQAEGLPVYHGDALSVDVLEEAGARYVDTVLALTTNTELNTLVADRLRDNFRVQRLLVVVDESTRQAHGEQIFPFPGNFSGPDDVNRALRLGRLRIVEYRGPEGAEERSVEDLPYGPGEFALFVYKRDKVFFASTGQTLAAGDRLLCAIEGEESPLSSLLVRLREFDPRHPPPMASAPA